ncbi:MAG: DivIVA domain-containing protein [Candidatus Cloacimonadota bacterium]|nr:DivIVA domain-containing protein [Candidatus Cloacimonadota bacterium]
MEKLQMGPVDIRHYEFSSALRGYKKDEVDEFLEIVATQMEDLLFQKKKSSPQIEPKKKKEIKKVEENEEPSVNKIELPKEKKSEEKKDTSIDGKAQELLISKTLILAEQMREKIVGEAKEKAEKILSDANNEAKTLVTDAQNSLSNLVQEYYEIKGLKKKYLKNVRSDLQVVIDRIDQKSLLKNEVESELDDKFDFLSKQVGVETKDENDK